MDLEELKKILSEYGEVFEVMDSDLDGAPAKIVFIACSFVKGIKLKSDLNCVSAEDNRYVLFPMENLQEKQKVLNARKGL